MFLNNLIYKSDITEDKIKKIFKNLKEDFNKRVKERHVLCDTSFFLPPIISNKGGYFLDCFFQNFSKYGQEDFGTFKKILNDYGMFQGRYLDFVEYVLKKPHTFILEEVFNEFNNFKSRFNKNKKRSLPFPIDKLAFFKREKLNEYKKYFGEMVKSDKHVFSRLVRMIDGIQNKSIQDERQFIIPKNSEILDRERLEKILPILNNHREGYTNYYDERKFPSDVDVHLAACLFLGYDVFSNDGDIRVLGYSAYNEISKNLGVCGDCGVWYLNEDLGIRFFNPSRNRFKNGAYSHKNRLTGSYHK